MSLQREKLIEIKADIDIEPGTEWERDIDYHLENAQIILLLISADFIASNYSYEKEMQQALRRHEQGTARVIPIIIRPCSWQRSPFGKLQALPKDAKPVSSWRNEDEAYNNIIEGLRAILQPYSHSETPTQKYQQPQPALDENTLCDSLPYGSLTPQELYNRIVCEPLFLDDSLKDNSSGNDWQTGKSEGGKSRSWFSGEVYHLSTSIPNFNYYSTALSANFSNFAYQIRMTIIKGSSGGIIFRADDAQSRFYLFRIDRSGNYNLFVFIDNFGEHARTLKRGFVSAFETGLGKPNQIAVVAYKDNLYLYVNQQFATNTNDSTLSSGQIGVIAYAEEKITEVVFSNAQVWRLERR